MFLEIFFIANVIKELTDSKERINSIKTQKEEIRKQRELLINLITENSSLFKETLTKNTMADTTISVFLIKNKESLQQLDKD